MKYTLEVLSPLHIGSGESINPIEYSLADEFYRADMNRMFEDPRFNSDQFIKGAKGGALYLGNFAPELAKEHLRYALEISQSAKTNLQGMIGRPGSEVREYIKTKDEAFIPGSSIKGAIRTAILWWVLKNDANKLYKAKSSLERLVRSRDKDAKKSVDGDVEREVFGGDPSHDILKALQVSDTATVDVQTLKIQEVRTLSTTPQGHIWKFSTFIEALKPKTKLDLVINVNTFFIEGEAAKDLQFEDKRELIKEIPRICNESADDFIRNELTFLKQYNTQRELLDFYRGLAEPKGSNSFLLHLAWGSGWHGMTVGKLFDVKMLRESFDIGKNIRRSFCKRCNTQLVKERQSDRFFDYCSSCRRHLRREDQYQKIVDTIWPFPKTRRIVFEDGTPKYPLGWVKVSLKNK